MNTYHSFYKGKKLEHEADTQLKARDAAVVHFKARKPWDVQTVLVALAGKQVVHSTAEVG